MPLLKVFLVLAGLFVAWLVYKTLTKPQIAGQPSGPPSLLMTSPLSALSSPMFMRKGLRL